MSGLEFLPFLAIPTLVTAIIQTAASCKKLQLDIKSSKAQKAIKGDLLEQSRQEICNTFNNCFVVLGSQFSEGDPTALAELRKIYEILELRERQLEEKRQKLQYYINESASDGSSLDTQLIMDLESTKLSMRNLAQRKGWTSALEDSSARSGVEDAIQRLFPSYNSDTDFCAGAVYLQQNPTAPLSSIASSLPGEVGYKCDYCALEFRYDGIGLHGPVKLRESQWRSFAKCHIQACTSFQNLAAWYMCEKCYGWNHNPPQIFASAAAMRKHLKGHGI